MKIIKLLLLSFIVLPELVLANYLAQIEVNRYQNIIRSLCDYYECHSLNVVYTKSNSEMTEDVELTTIMKISFIKFGSRLFLKTAVFDVEGFSSKFDVNNFEGTTRPLYVLLGDTNIIARHLSQILVPYMDMSRSIWIHFGTSRIDNINAVFQNVYLPFNCQFMIDKKVDNTLTSSIITEIYRVDENSTLIEEYFGVWNGETGLTLPKFSVRVRRRNFYGYKLRAVVLPGPGVKVYRNKSGEVVKLGSYCGLILNLFAEILNYTLMYREVEVIGGCKNGPCTGGVGEMAEHSTDIFPFDLRISTARMNVMDYTTPLYVSDQRLYIQKPEKSKLIWDRFLRPFEIGVWDVFLGIFAVHVALVLVTKFFRQNTLIETTDTIFDTEYTKISDICFMTFMMLCFKSIPEPSLSSLRLTQFTLFTTITILYAAYSAILISSLTLRPFEPPFTTMEGLKQDGSYDLGILKDSADYDYFQNTTIEILADLFEIMMAKEDKLPTARSEGLRRICNNSKYAYMTPDITTFYFPAKNCRIVPLDVIARAHFSFALQRNSPFRGIINYEIGRIRQSGILRKIFEETKEVRGNNISTPWLSIEFFDIAPLVVLLLSGYISSIMVLMGELIYHNYKHRKTFTKVEKIVTIKPNLIPYSH